LKRCGIITEDFTSSLLVGLAQIVVERNEARNLPDEMKQNKEGNQSDCTNN